MLKEPYIINPSALSYACFHCEYMNINYGLKNEGVRAPVTNVLDTLEKKLLLEKKTNLISSELKEGTIIDPSNNTFYSKVKEHENGISFRIKGKCDAIVKYTDGSSGIIDYKTSKFRNNPYKENKAKFNEKNFKIKLNEYGKQLHAYRFLYSNLETDDKFIKEVYVKNYIDRYRVKDPSKIEKFHKKIIEQINNIAIEKVNSLGLLLFYPEKLIESTKDTTVLNEINFNFGLEYFPVSIDEKEFYKQLGELLKVLNQAKPPNPPEECKRCTMHKAFYDDEKVIKFERKMKL